MGGQAILNGWQHVAARTGTIEIRTSNPADAHGIIKKYAELGLSGKLQERNTFACAHSLALWLLAGLARERSETIPREEDPEDLDPGGRFRLLLKGNVIFTPPP